MTPIKTAVQLHSIEFVAKNYELSYVQNKIMPRLRRRFNKKRTDFITPEEIAAFFQVNISYLQ